MPMGAMGWMITMPMMMRSQRVRTRRSFTGDCAGSLAIGPFENAICDGRVATGSHRLRRLPGPALRDRPLQSQRQVQIQRQRQRRPPEGGRYKFKSQVKDEATE